MRKSLTPHPMASSDSKGFFVSAPQIRAPLTLEVDDSEFYVSSNATLSQSDYTSQEEEEEEDCFEADERVQLSPMHVSPLRVTPFAHLSTFNDDDDVDDDDDDDEEEEEEVEEEGGGEMLSVARVPGNFDGTPRIKMLDAGEESDETSIFKNSLPVSQSLLANDFTFFSDSDEYSFATDSDVMSQHSQDEQFGMSRGVVLNELEKEPCGIAVKLIETDTIIQRKLVEGTSIVVGDTCLLKFSVEDCEEYNNSIMQDQNVSFNYLQEHNSQVHCMSGEPVSAENVEYSAATQTTEANGSPGVVSDQESDCENLVSVTRTVVNSNAQLQLHDSSAGFESNDDAYESNKILSVESCEPLDPTHLQEYYLQKDLSKTILGVNLEDELLCDYHLHENVETLNLGNTAKEKATVELKSASQELERQGSASDGGEEELMSVALEQFREQISALSILLCSKGSGRDSLEKQVIRSSHGTTSLPRDDAKSQLIYAGSDAESDGSSGTVTSADESSVIFLKDPASFSSLSYYDALVDFQHNITEKEKEKIQKIQAISVKFLRLVQRVNLSFEDSLVSKVLCRLVTDIERGSNQEFVIKLAKTSAKKLEENCQDDLDFSLNILVLGRSGVGKSATINSIFGDMKVVTNAFEPTTTSVKEVSGTIDGIKIRILDTPGLKSTMKEQAYNRKILSSIKRYMKKFPPDVILYVDRVDDQTRDLNDLPILRSITSSLSPSIWQHAIFALTHAASVPLDGPSGSPLSYEVFVAQKSYLVQQSITQAVRNLCQLSPSFMCPVALVENHPLCGKNMSGDCVLPNGLRWRSQLLALCSSLKILSEVSSVSGSQTLFDHWKHFFFQDHSQPLCHFCNHYLIFLRFNEDISKTATQ
ncbi:Translocase of chloroplast 159, chloroplastic, partial [Mucuna pruriens]